MLSTGQFVFPPDPNCDFDWLYDELVMNGNLQVFCEMSQETEVENEHAEL